MLFAWWDLTARLGREVSFGTVYALAGCLAAILFERWRLRRIRRQIQQQVEQYWKYHPQKEAALLLSVGREIEPDVRRYLDEHEATRGMPLSAVFQKEGLDLREESWAAFFERFRSLHRELNAAGVQRIHLFANLPVALALQVGAGLLPGAQVVVYHHQGNGYHPVARLAVETVRL
jgi:hypothetical protein